MGLLRVERLYARWQDAFLLITKDSNGVLYGNVTSDTWAPYGRGRDPAKYPDALPGSRRVEMRPLERDTVDATLLRLPNPRTLLFRDKGNGQLETLTDVFVYKSGDYKAARVLPSGDVE